MEQGTWLVHTWGTGYIGAGPADKDLGESKIVNVVWSYGRALYHLKLVQIMSLFCSVGKCGKSNVSM